MESILITSIPSSNRLPLKSVLQINNALRRHEPVFCTRENGETHEITTSRHQGLTFQVRIGGQWIDTSLKNVWKEKGAVQVNLAMLSHREALMHAMTILKARSFRAILDAGPTWEIVFKRARRWSPIGGTGDLISTATCLQQSFDENGTLITPLPCAWTGNFEILAACLHEYGFAVKQAESPDPHWLWLTIFLPSQENQVTHT